MSRIRLVPVILIALISLGVLFAGWYTYQRVNLVNPLRTDLQKVSGVKTVQIQTGNPTVVNVQLGQVKDLQTTYNSINQVVTNDLGSSARVELQDDPSQELTDDKISLMPYINQGLRKADYPQMISTVNQLTSKMKIDARITMDENRVYIQLSKGSHYLYKVMPLSTQQGGATS